MITATIPFYKQKQAGNTPVNAPVNALGSTLVELTSTQKDILNLVRADLNITIDEIVKILGKDRRTITRNIKVLKENEIVVRVGSDKSGHWKIIE